jgi:pimeloyl-ACP methyl ester carboxylesterase
VREILTMREFATSRRRILAGLVAALVLLGACALVEHLLEARDAARLTAHETFVQVHGGRVRYRLTGTDQTGPTLVLLSGLAASLEQWDSIQTTLAESAPVLSYDRAGMGFSDPTDGHDAEFEADELEGVLHAPDVTPPFVLVAYSGSSNVAKVFTERHRDEVAGLVFLDPTAPDAARALEGAGYQSYFRRFGRGLVERAIESLFGGLRVARAISSRRGPPASGVAARADAELISFHHCRATLLEVMNLERADLQARTISSFGAIPLGVLSTFDPDESALYRYVTAVHRELAKQSTRGTFVAGAHVGHSNVLVDPAMSGVVMDLVRKIAGEARQPEIAAASPRP